MSLRLFLLVTIVPLFVAAQAGAGPDAGAVRAGQIASGLMKSHPVAWTPLTAPGSLAPPAADTRQGWELADDWIKLEIATGTDALSAPVVSSFPDAWSPRRDSFIKKLDPTAIVEHSGDAWYDPRQEIIHVHMQEQYGRVMQDWVKAGQVPLVMGEFWMGGRGETRLTNSHEYIDREDWHTEEARLYREKMLEMRYYCVSGIMPFHLHTWPLVRNEAYAPLQQPPDADALQWRFPNLRNFGARALAPVVGFVWPRGQSALAGGPFTREIVVCNDREEAAALAIDCTFGSHHESWRVTMEPADQQRRAGHTVLVLSCETAGRLPGYATENGGSGEFSGTRGGVRDDPLFWGVASASFLPLKQSAAAGVLTQVPPNARVVLGGLRRLSQRFIGVGFHGLETLGAAPPLAVVEDRDAGRLVVTTLEPWDPAAESHRQLLMTLLANAGVDVPNRSHRQSIIPVRATVPLRLDGHLDDWTSDMEDRAVSPYVHAAPIILTSQDAANGEPGEDLKHSAGQRLLLDHFHGQPRPPRPAHGRRDNRGAIPDPVGTPRLERGPYRNA